MPQDGTKTKNKMKKQIRKLNLNKRTISNLSTSQMDGHVGGNPTNGKNCQPTHGRTCQGTCGFSCGGSRCEWANGYLSPSFS